jgi:hypothetical protein
LDAAAYLIGRQYSARVDDRVAYRSTFQGRKDLGAQIPRKNVSIYEAGRYCNAGTVARVVAHNVPAVLRRDLCRYSTGRGYKPAQKKEHGSDGHPLRHAHFCRFHDILLSAIDFELTVVARSTSRTVNSLIGDIVKMEACGWADSE